MMDSIATNFQIDENRIYMCGISAGATMAYYMACRTDRLAAFGSVAGAMSKVNYQNCAPSHPIPLIDFRGTDDTVGPWNGDINTEGIETIISFWVNKNMLIRFFPQDNSTYTRHTQLIYSQKYL